MESAMEALGPTGVRVGRRLGELRRERGLTLRELAAKLAELGRPLLLSALSKIERGQRRVDTDDLVALALALDVSPSSILLPKDATLVVDVELTRSSTMDAESAWRWVTHDGPLDPAVQVDSGLTTRLGNQVTHDGLLQPVVQAAVVPAEVRQEYQERLVARYRRLDLEILTPKEQDEHRQVLLRSVFVPQHARADYPPVELPKKLWRRLVEAGEFDDKDLPAVVDLERVAKTRQAYQQQPARPVLDVLAEPGRRLIVVLGDPGAGKSTLARYVALELAADQPQGPLAALAGSLPLLVELRTYADPRWRERTFLDLIDHLHETEGLGLSKDVLEAYLGGGGRAVVVFDGLDEVFDPAVRETITRQIVGFAARYPTARVVVTSRIIGYRRAVLAGAGFDHFTVQELDRDQVERFVSLWYELACPDDPGEATRRQQRLLAAVNGSPSLRELAGNPLLLTILAIIGRRQELPRDRRSVYAHAAAVLVEHWDVERHLRHAHIDLPYIGPEDKHELLQHVARRMQDGPDGLTGNHISGADLITEFSGYLQQRYQLPLERAIPAARAILAQFRERNFILSHFGAEVYGFVHRAFLEYFSAADIVSRFEQERSLDEQQLTLEVFGRHWADPTWQEILLLVAGMINERFTSRIIDHLLRANPLWFLHPEQPPRHVLLAVRCMGEVRKLGLLAPSGGATIAAVTALLDMTGKVDSFSFSRDYLLLDSVVASLRQVALPVFEALGDTWPGRERYLAWYRLRGQDLTLQARHPTYSEERSALTALILAALYPDNLQVRSLLQTQATSGADGDVRRAAVQALAAGWAADPQTLSWLRQRATDDPQEAVRRAAVQALAAGWAADPQTLSWLRQRATDDPSEWVRRAAVQALAAGWAADPQTLSWLRQRATDDPQEAVRRAAVEGVAAGWATDPQILSWLCQRATDDPHWDVRRAAVQVVAAGWAADPQILSWLCQRATDDPSEWVRRVAVQVVAAGWAEDPQTLPWLRQRATDDAHWAVRRAAVEGVAVGWATDPQTLPWLRQRATDDPDEDVREAVDRLVSEWLDA